MHHLFGRLAVVIITTLGLLAAGSGLSNATTSSPLPTLTEVNEASDGMGSPAVETSAATYNADRNVLFTLDDEHNAYEFQLTADGFIDNSSIPRVIELELGTDDFEGVAWISGETYAFLSEGSGEVIIATVPASDTITTQNIERSFPVISGTWGNLGPEGLATDGDAFYVVREKPATLSKFNFDGSFVGAVSLTNIDDASGVAVLADGTYLVTSHESRLVAHYVVDWDAESVTLLDERAADDFTQLEGIAVVGNTDVHLVGEDNTRKGYPGQTYSHLNGLLTQPAFAISDVDCSGSIDLGDALLVAKLDVGALAPIDGCGSGDHDGDGFVNLGDAVLIAQCSVGVPNAGCPAIVD